MRIRSIPFAWITTPALLVLALNGCATKQNPTVQQSKIVEATEIAPTRLATERLLARIENAGVLFISNLGDATQYAERKQQVEGMGLRIAVNGKEVGTINPLDSNIIILREGKYTIRLSSISENKFCNHLEWIESVTERTTRSVLLTYELAACPTQDQLNLTFSDGGFGMISSSKRVNTNLVGFNRVDELIFNQKTDYEISSEKLEADRQVRELKKKEEERQIRDLAEARKMELERIARVGDDSPDDLACKRRGFNPMTPVYKKCKMALIESHVKAEAAQKAREDIKNEKKQMATKIKNFQNSNTSLSGGVSIEAAKSKCSDLGFKSATEGFGKCVLQLSR